MSKPSHKVMKMENKKKKESQRRKDYYRANKKKIDAQQKRYYEKHKASRLWIMKRYRDKMKLQASKSKASRGALIATSRDVWGIK